MKSVIFAEDDQFLGDLIAKKLTAEGYTVTLAVNGEDALNKIKSAKPDLVLLDLLLPAINGFDVLAQLKSDPVTKGIPVIVLSNTDQKADIDRVMNLGAGDFMNKSQFTAEEIVEKIKEFLGQ
jgi:CheY-like chemotaxis protein